MNKHLKQIIACIITLILVISITQINIVRGFGESVDTSEVAAEITNNLGLTSKAYILMEASTGKVICENNADEMLSPASITKIMTLILVFEAIDAGKIKLEDLVTTSEYAKSMGGSQVFLETGEQQTVETLIKCIVVASGNDASVCMAEFIAGSETEFVNQMNNKAAELGMTNTVFKDCCGLCDSMDHHSTARDVAIMSRELITKHPEIKNYSNIWMEDITHVTAKGSSTFTLANTNKLIKQYEWTTGLKTGSTSLAKYCLSATAKKNDVELIAVIMAAPDYKARFAEAIMLLNYGFSNITMYKDNNDDCKKQIKVKGGTKANINILPESSFSYICTDGENPELISKQIELDKKISAPVKKLQIVGTIKYYIGDNEIGSVNLIAAESTQKAGYLDYFKKICYKYIV